MARPSGLRGRGREHHRQGRQYRPDGGTDLDVSCTADGKFTAFNGGTWRIDGDELCTRGDDENETCMAYPAGKKSGDSFQLDSPTGPIPAHIK